MSNPQFIRDKARKFRACAFCQKPTRLRVSYQVGPRTLANRCLCAVCLQALGMMAQAQKMLGEEDDTLKPSPTPPVLEEWAEEGESEADVIDDVTAAGYAAKRELH